MHNLIKAALPLLRLALRRYRSIEDYQALQSFLAEHSVTELKSKGVNFWEATLLEIGAGAGGYSHVLRSVVDTYLATDLHVEKWATEYQVPFVQLDVNHPLPFLQNSFDLIYCSSLIEHLHDPEGFLSDVWRVVRPNGLLYLSFPPFYLLAVIVSG